MKKLLAIILSLLVVLSLAACSGGDTASDPSSSDPSSSSPKPLGSAVGGSDEDDDAASSADDEDSGAIEYTSVAKGYIDHPTIWDGKIVNFSGYECMDDEYLVIPKGATIMTDKKLAIFCYKVSDGEIVLSPDTSKKLGCTLTATGYSVQHIQKESYETTEEVIVRFSVRGALSDINIYFPKEFEGGAKLYSSEKLIEEFSK